jgi:hypothetical protein
MDMAWKRYRGQLVLRGIKTPYFLVAWDGKYHIELALRRRKL